MEKTERIEEITEVLKERLNQIIEEDGFQERADGFSEAMDLSIEFLQGE
jgi:metal-responsive CopG/Arc/MetJ family transcriptional regulator